MKKTAQNRDRFSATFLKNTEERHEREKKTRAFSFSSKKKKQKVSRARKGSKKKEAKRDRCFFAAFVLPSSAGVQVFHLRTQRSISICSRGFSIRREDNEQSLTFTARNHAKAKESSLRRKVVCASFRVIFRVPARKRVELKEMKWTILEPSSDEDWTTGEVPKPRSHHASIALNTNNNASGTKKVLICGGVCAKTNQLLKDCWTLDVIEKRWQRIGDLPRGAAWGHLIRYHGLIVHVGGVSSSGSEENVLSASSSFFSSFFSSAAALGSYESLTSSMREPEKVKVYALDEENGMSWIESPTTGDVPTEKVGSACVSLGDRAIVLHGGKCLGGIQKDVHFGSLRILDVPTMTWIAPVSKRDGYEEVEPGVHLKPLPRCAHVAVLMSGKRIAFLGGKNKSGPIYDGCADVYDYLNNRWLRPIEVFGENIIVDTTCYAQTDVGTYCFMERNGDVNALDVNEMVWDPSLVRCDNLHELEDDIAGRSMTLCGDVLVVVGGAKKDLSGGSRYRVGGYNDDEMMAATWTTRLAPANAAIVGKGENAVLPRKMEANPTAAAANMQKVGVWDGGIGKAASAWNDALSEQPSSFQQTQTQQQKKHDFDRFSRNSYALGSDSAERDIEGISRIGEEVQKQKNGTHDDVGTFTDSREKNAMTRRLNDLMRDLENEKQLREKIERMNDDLTLELKQYVGRKNVNVLAKELEADREKLAKMTEDMKKQRDEKDKEYEQKFEALRLSENEREDARMCKKWKQIAETSGEKYDELLVIAQTQKEGLDELCDVFPGAKRYLDRAIPSLASVRIPRVREQIMPSWFSDDARHIKRGSAADEKKGGGFFGSSSFLGGFL